MKFLTLEQIKAQCRIEEDFTLEDTKLTLYGDSAEQVIFNTHVGNAQAAAELLRSWDAYFCNPGHGSLHNAYAPGFSTFTIFGSFAGSGDGQIMQMDGQCAAAAAVLELMAHEVNGKVEFFKGCPESWREVSFENLALSDGRRVSGKRVDGRVSVTPAP